MFAKDMSNHTLGRPLDMVDVSFTGSERSRPLNGQIDLLVEELVQHLNAGEHTAAHVKLRFVERSIAARRPIFVAVRCAAIFELQLAPEPSQFVLDVSVELRNPDSIGLRPPPIRAHTSDRLRHFLRHCCPPRTINRHDSDESTTATISMMDPPRGPRLLSRDPSAGAIRLAASVAGGPREA